MVCHDEEDREKLKKVLENKFENTFKIKCVSFEEDMKEHNNRKHFSLK